MSVCIALLFMSCFFLLFGGSAFFLFLYLCFLSHLFSIPFLSCCLLLLWVGWWSALVRSALVRFVFGLWLLFFSPSFFFCRWCVVALCLSSAVALCLRLCLRSWCSLSAVCPPSVRVSVRRAYVGVCRACLTGGLFHVENPPVFHVDKWGVGERRRGLSFLATIKKYPLNYKTLRYF